MTNAVDETTRGRGGYVAGQAGNEGSAPSMEEGRGTDGQAASPGIGQAETGAVEAAGGTGPQEAPDRAGSGPRQESRIVRELKDQRRKKREAQAAAAYWKGVADGRMGPQAGVPPRGGAASPDPTAFESLDDYEDALSGYPDDEAEGGPAGSTLLDRAATALSDGYPSAAPVDALLLPPPGAPETDRAFSARIAEAAAGEFPEIGDIVNDVTLHVSGPMAAVIKASEEAPALLRYLAAHRDEARRIYDLAPTMILPDGRQVQGGNPLAAAAELGRIASRLSAGKEQPHTRRVSSAPEPVVPVGGGSGTIEADDERVPIEEFVRRRNEAQYSHSRKRR